MYNKVYQNYCEKKGSSIEDGNLEYLPNVISACKTCLKECMEPESTLTFFITYKDMYYLPENESSIYERKKKKERGSVWATADFSNSTAYAHPAARNRSDTNIQQCSASSDCCTGLWEITGCVIGRNQRECLCLALRYDFPEFSNDIGNFDFKADMLGRYPTE